MKHIEDDQPALAGDSTIDSEVNPGLIVDQLSTAVWIFDIDNGQVTWANDAALEVWAAGSRDELFARDMKSGMSPAVARRLRQYQSDFIERNATFTEMWTLYPNGAPRPMRSSAPPPTLRCTRRRPSSTERTSSASGGSTTMSWGMGRPA